MIVLGIMLILLICLCMFSCVKAGAEADRRMEELKRTGSKKQNLG